MYLLYIIYIYVHEGMCEYMCKAILLEFPVGCMERNMKLAFELQKSPPTELSMEELLQCVSQLIQELFFSAKDMY